MSWLFGILATVMVAVAGPPAVGDGSVFATVPEYPGYPEALVIDRGRVFVTAPATFNTAGLGPSEVLVYQRATGELVETLTVSGEDLDQEHAVSGITVDAYGRLYVLSTQLGVLRFTQENGAWTQESYSTPFPDLNPSDFIPPLPNDAIFDDAGNLYVTDSLQATIWRIPAGGGAPQAWFTDSRLIITGADQLGPNGIRPNPERDALYFAYSGGPANEGELAQAGHIYKLPLVEAPTAADLEVVHTYDEFSVPDGIAFTRKGDLYVVLAGYNAISVLSLEGTVSETSVISGPNGSAVPFMQPANLVFDSGSVLVTNHAVFLPREQAAPFFSVLDVFVGEQGDHLPRPHVD